jgi:hypothetical protein
MKEKIEAKIKSHKADLQATMQKRNSHRAEAEKLTQRALQLEGAIYGLGELLEPTEETPTVKEHEGPSPMAPKKARRAKLAAIEAPPEAASDGDAAKPSP